MSVIAVSLLGCRAPGALGCAVCTTGGTYDTGSGCVGTTNAGCYGPANSQNCGCVVYSCVRRRRMALLAATGAGKAHPERARRACPISCACVAGFYCPAGSSTTNGTRVRCVVIWVVVVVPVVVRVPACASCTCVAWMDACMRVLVGAWYVVYMFAYVWRVCLHVCMFPRMCVWM